MAPTSERNHLDVPTTRLLTQTTAAKLLRKHRQQIPTLVAHQRLVGEMIDGTLFVTRDSVLLELERQQQREAADAATAHPPDPDTAQPTPSAA